MFAEALDVEFLLSRIILAKWEFAAKQTVLITGAGDGLGKALAISAAALGATVILLGRTVAKLEAVYDEIEQAGGSQAAIYPLDLAGATIEHYEQMAESIGGEFGKLDSLAHCAASLGPMTPLARYPASDWQKTLQINLTGPTFLTQACLPLLIDSGRASLIYTLDDKSRAYWGAYGISKAAVESSMRIFAEELDNTRNDEGAHAVSVNAVAPGPMRTQIRRLAYPGENMQSVPLPENFLNEYLYLLDPLTEKPHGAIVSKSSAGN